MTGAYLAGEQVGVTDRVRVNDDVCGGEAIAEIRIVRAMNVHPSNAQLAVNTQIRFEIDEGSGAFSFELLRSESGGNIEPDGTFRSGPQTGIDSIRVTDAQTGEVVDVAIQIVQSVTLKPSPKQLVLPVGSRAALQIAGGTGRFDVAFEGDGLDYDGSQFIGRTPGRFAVTVRDHFVPELVTNVTVDVVASLAADMPPFSDLQTAVRLYNPGDLNRDGKDDLVIASNEADVLAGDSGAVFIYHSTEEGPLELVQTISGLTRYEDLGRAAAFADLNGDNLTDIAIGVRLADPGFNDAGHVQVHLGQPDGRFGQEPAQIVTGIRSGDYLGFGVAACDFNGDGRMDIAASALYYEDAAARPQSNTQGAVFIFLGYEDGFLAQPDQIVVGRRLSQNGNWSHYADLQMGYDVVAGDMNGDERCDLAVSTVRYAQPGQGGAGAVFVYAGRQADALSPGG